jgi:hypothetical protein
MGRMTGKSVTPFYSALFAEFSDLLCLGSHEMIKTIPS